MGIKSLSTILNQYAKNGIKNVTLDVFKGNIIAIDTSIFLYKFTYNTSDCLEGFTRQILRLLKNGIIPLYIFDGKPPNEKKDILIIRKDKKELLIKKKNIIDNIINNRTNDEVLDENIQSIYNELIDKPSEFLKIEYEKINKKIINITSNDVENTKKLFDLFGVPYIIANGEAEAFCAYLSRKGFVNGCITEDTDYLASGGNNFIRNFNSCNNNVCLYKINDILLELNITYDQFIDMCILCGCDYTSKITGIGAIKAYKFIKKFNNIEKIIIELSKSNSYKVPYNFDYIRARTLLKCENMFDNEIINPLNFKVSLTDENELVNYLKENSKKLKSGFYNEIISKLNKYKNNIYNLKPNEESSKKIDDYFKKKYYITDEIDIKSTTIF